MAHFNRRMSQCTDVGLVLVRLILETVLGQHHAEVQNLVESGIPQSHERLH